MRAVPRVLVFPYHATATKERRERHTLREFCNAMHRQHRAEYSVVTGPVSRRIVVVVGGATVDGVVKTPAGRVAVELLSLSPVSDRGDVLEADLAMRRRLRASIGRFLVERGWSLTLWYREGRRPNGTRVTLVPRNPADARALVGEIKRLLLELPAPDLRSSIMLHVASISREDAARMQRRGRYYFPADEYPACYRHLVHVRVYSLPNAMTPDIESDLKVGFIGADTQFLAAKLRDKAERSLGLSRERANGLPLWLIVHSDGRAIHQSIAPPQRRGAIQTCRDLLSTMDHGFERAYWADQTGFLNAAWVGRIV
jgi:hypothetical protein